MVRSFVETPAGLRVVVIRANLCTGFERYQQATVAHHLDLQILIAP